MSPICAVVHALDGLEVAGVMAVERAGNQAEPLLLDLLVRLEAAAHAGAVHRDRLLGEDVLAGRDGRLDVIGPETRRRRQDHVVDVGREQLLVGVEPDEAVSSVTLDLVAEPLGQDRARRVEPILEGVGHRDDADAAARRRRRCAPRPCRARRSRSRRPGSRRCPAAHGCRASGWRRGHGRPQFVRPARHRHRRRRRLADRSIAGGRHHVGALTISSKVTSLPV